MLCSPDGILLEKLKTTRGGLSSEEAGRRATEFGRNEVAARKRRSVVWEFLSYFKNPLIIILLGAAAISGVLGDVTDTVIIIVIILVSVLLDFIQEYRAGKAAEELQKRIQTTTTVLRDGIKKELPLADIVPGDVITLSAGDIVPADGRLLVAKDLFAQQSMLTGESIPTEKFAAPLKPADIRAITGWTNYVFMGSSIISGTGIAVMVKTGITTEYGKIVKRAIEKKPITEFESSLRKFGIFILRVTMLLVGFVFLVNAVLGRNVLDSLLFAIALSVGLTPDLLPMIISVSLSKAAVAMSKKKVIVKRLNAIQNFGSMDVLCTDKTGTLTENKVSMILHIDINGKTNEKVFLYSYLNSFFQTGLKSPLDEAILNFADRTKVKIGEYSKDDEIPFDFIRKRTSIIVKHGKDLEMFTKGAPDAIEKVCKFYELDDQVKPMDDQFKNQMDKTFTDLSLEGYRLLGIAYKLNPVDRGNFEIVDETGMVFLGFVAFMDTPKVSTKDAVKALKERGIELKILTGDNELITKKICRDLDIDIKGILLGSEIAALGHEELCRVVERTNIFARVTPSQKEQIIEALKYNKHVVGFIGDGINDTPPMKVADVSISVENAVDAAKETADIILLEKDLRVLADGVLEGRVTFGNNEKYMNYSISSNFGTMFSAALGSLFVPFLPMLPAQVLLNNLLNDVAQITLPGDSVDKEYIMKPRKISIPLTARFMVCFGPMSSVFDIVMFIAMLGLFWPFNTDGSLNIINVRLFQTAFFVETLTCQLIIIFVIRTRQVPFWKSKPKMVLVISVFAILGLTLLLPFLPIGSWFDFLPLPPVVFLVLVACWVSYIAIVEVMKRWFYRRFAHIQ